MRAFPLWVYDLYGLYKIIYRFIILRIPPGFRPRLLPGENMETRGPRVNRKNPVFRPGRAFRRYPQGFGTNLT